MALDRREFEQFMNQARIKLPGASDAGITAELYDVLKEFFRDTNAWTEDIQFTPILNQKEYRLTPSTRGNHSARWRLGQQGYPCTSIYASLRGGATAP